MANEKNLIPNNLRSKKEVRENSRKGGIASGKKRKEKKLMSQIYADFLAAEHDIIVKAKKEKVSGPEYMRIVADQIFKKGGSPAVSLMKEIREATEGNKVDMTSGGKPLPVTININPVKVKDEQDS